VFKGLRTKCQPGVNFQCRYQLRVLRNAPCGDE